MSEFQNIGKIEKRLDGTTWYDQDYVDNLEQENKQLKEQLENKIDLYEDTISYQLGFDKGKEELQQRIDEAIEYINKTQMPEGYKKMLLEILGDKENE